MAESDRTAETRPGHALIRARGGIRYTDDIPTQGALHAKIVRSTVAHATITGIDASEASALDGVVGVLTLADLRAVTKDCYYGPAYRDQPILADGKVRHFGEPIAVVLADDPRTATAAAQLVEVEFDELPMVLDEVEAATSDVVIHDDINAAADFEDLRSIRRSQNPNVYVTHRLRSGDFDEVARTAHRVIEHRFHTASTCATPLETISTHASPTAGGGLEVRSQTQMPSYVRRQLSRIFGLPEAMIRVTQAPLGGGFGLKIYIRLEALTAACALYTGRTVVLKCDMEEQFYLPNRRGTTSEIASALDAEGTVLARRCRIYWNGGGYADIGPRMVAKSGFVATGPYDIPVVDLESNGVYTNRVPGGAIRGFGVPEAVWAHEMHTNMVAAELGVDPMQFRMRQLLGRDDKHASGTALENCDPRQVLTELHDVLESVPLGAELPASLQGWRLGRGLSVGLKAVITPTTSVAKVTVSPDGSITVHSGTVEMGQGSTEAMKRMVARELGVPNDQVNVVSGDTDSVPWDTGTMGSRSTYHMSRALANAVADLREQLAGIVGSALDTAPPTDGNPFHVEGGVPALLRKHFGGMGASLVGVGSFTPRYEKPDQDGKSDRIAEFWMCGATGVDIAVDPATGVLKLLRLASVADVGRAVNPAMVHTQLSGAAVMQASMSIVEQVQYDESGQVLNPSLALYRIFGFGDSPRQTPTGYVEYGEDATPKGCGESGSLAVAPAIAAAVHDALGVWVCELPITPEKILRAFTEGEQR
ncbi:xanthine dehydrogenase family protein molybdopterin-binding subunit (plasmid) [Mycolicibacterium psychrotolerans]|uniref:xanthine dehydrogenase family protein molybdopterin-binding subunit n=1 Tax=Mycolicibacterium psychrotolerans TaxID=216929 RepID=UPI003D674FEA